MILRLLAKAIGVLNQNHVFFFYKRILFGCNGRRIYKVPRIVFIDIQIYKVIFTHWINADLLIVMIDSETTILLPIIYHIIKIQYIETNGFSGHFNYSFYLYLLKFTRYQNNEFD